MSSLPSLACKSEEFENVNRTVLILAIMFFIFVAFAFVASAENNTALRSNATSLLGIQKTFSSEKGFAWTYRLDKSMPISCSTGSMVPTLDCHSNITAVGVYNATLLRKGDIIAFSITTAMRQFLGGESYVHGMGYILHRIVSIEQYGFKTAGDNNGYDDPWLVEPRLVHYKVVKIE